MVIALNLNYLMPTLLNPTHCTCHARDQAPKLVGPLHDYPQTTVEKGASAFELDFVCLFDCLWANILISLHILLCSPLLRNSKKFATMNPKILLFE